MQGHSYQINIPTPCSQNWQHMRPDGDGRFCSHCQKTVIDFSALTDQQIIDKLNQANGHLCGRFTGGQLNRPLTVSVLAPQRYSFKRALAAVLLLLSAKPVVAGVNKAPMAVYESVLVKDELRENPVKDNGSDTGVVIGQVIDRTTGEGVFQAVVVNLASKSGVETDTNGNFKIRAAVGDTLEMSYIGYEKRNFVITNFTGRQRFEIHERMLTGLSVTTIVVRSSLRNRIRRFFGMKTY